MFTCRGLFFSAVLLTVAVMNHQMEIFATSECVWEYKPTVYITYHFEIFTILCPLASCPPPVWWNVASSWSHPPLVSPAPSLLRTGVTWTSLQKDLIHGAAPGTVTLSVWMCVFTVSRVCVLRVCGRLAACLGSQFKGRQHHRAFCMCVWYRARVRAQHVYEHWEKKGNEIRYWMNYRACIVICRVFFRVLGRIEFVWKNRCVF